ncbi:MAG: FMN-binding protein [Oscillospiraceae bacterium]|nr:FMN-binding protein [Oscillospiraceae bacterium]
MFNEKIKPPLVLTLICIIACGLLVAAYEATYVDTSGIITDKLTEGLTELYGSAEGFEMLKAPDGSVLTYEGVDSVLSDGTNVAFEITADGYSSGGLHLLVGITPGGTVQGVSLMDVSDTPGIGTRVQNNSFLSQFSGVSLDSINASQNVSTVKSRAVWGTHKEIVRLTREAELEGSSGSGFSLDAETGATLSSNGVYSGVRTALAAYESMGSIKEGDE